MTDAEWTVYALDRIREDVTEIKHDIKDLKSFRFRLAGGITVLCALLTVAVDAVVMWVRG